MRISFCSPLAVALTGIILGVAGSVALSAAPDAERIEAIAAMLPKAPRGVGRPIDDRAAWDPVAKSDEAAKTIRQAESLLGTPIPEITDELFLDYSRTGNRTRCQSVISRRRSRLNTLVLAECLENRGRFLAEIEKTLLATCDEKTWVLPAHDRGLTNFEGTQITIDLRSSAVGWTLATIDYWLAARLSPSVRERIAKELERRVFTPFEVMVTKGKPRMWWLAGTNNWNSVCLANVVGAAMAGVDSRERRAFFVASAEKYIDNFLRGFTSDGYCSEGLGYWNYGFGHFVLLAETVVQATGGRLDLMADPRVEPIARFGRRMEINPGVYPAFADCSPNAEPTSWIHWYVSRRFGFGWPEGRKATLSLVGSGGIEGFGLFGFTNSLMDREVGDTTELAQPPRDWFDQAGILVCRPAEAAKRSFGAAMKGGHNNEHHNHNDVGSFLVAVGDHAPLVDPGSEVYTGRTFSGNRYASGVLNSWGHPVPRVAGSLQETGKNAAAKVLESDFLDRTDTLALDLRAAYDVEGLKELTRRFVFSREGSGSLEVTDRVVFDKPNDFGTALVTFDAWERTGENTLRIGSGEHAVDVQIDTGGLPFDIKAEPIEEDLPGGKIPTRLGIDLSEPAAEATIRITIRPAA